MKRSKIMQDLLDAGAIIPECVEDFKKQIEQAKNEEAEQEPQEENE